MLYHEYSMATKQIIYRKASISVIFTWWWSWTKENLGGTYRMFGMLCNNFFSGEVYIADPYIDGKLM